MFTNISVSYLLQQYIESLLKVAKYEQCDKVGDWCAYIEEFPGVYAQKATVEETRNELEEILKEYILINLSKGLALPNFKKYVKIKFNQPQRAHSEIKSS